MQSSGVVSPYSDGGVHADDLACETNVSGQAYVAALGVYGSNDYGRSWHPFVAGLPEREYFAAVAATRADGDVFGGAYRKGVYLAPGGWRFWLSMNEGLRAQRIRALYVEHGDLMEVWAGTAGRGIWTYALFNYPAPFFTYVLSVLR